MSRAFHEACAPLDLDFNSGLSGKHGGHGITANHNNSLPFLENNCRYTIEKCYISRERISGQHHDGMISHTPLAF